MMASLEASLRALASVVQDPADPDGQSEQPRLPGIVIESLRDAVLRRVEVTVWRWTRKPEFQEAYLEVWGEVRSRTGSRLLQGSPAAATTMVKVMLDPGTPPSVRLRAAESIMQHAEKAYELENIGLRLKRLEKATGQK